MLSPKLRNQVFQLWTLFWSSGMTNPLVSIEQITYLLFLKQLETLDKERQERGLRSIYGPRKKCDLEHHPDDGKCMSAPSQENGDPNECCPGHNTCRWSYIRQNPSHEHISRFVFPWLREIDKILIETGNTERSYESIGGQMDDAYFQFPREKGAALKEAIQRIDKLFQAENLRGANADLMGDIFEYLLSEIQTSGKNGQFRTPRHIIRMMIELLNPDIGKRIVDPAAGTGGFLINSILHLRKRYTAPENVLLEWDGTPHRIDGAELTTADEEKYFSRRYFTGYDNDRTMVRIGWMNMILHGIEDPYIVRRDSLGKSLPDDESNAYDFVLTNPPFTGTVDKSDLHETRFPRNPRKTSEPITNKSELLFVWLMLDLLTIGGRTAVIVPEGVLFGSTYAHRELRRQLLFENNLEAVISLPGGVFQPYTGVKTSILVFQKYGERPSGTDPRTESVWFYEIEADGYTLDAKRRDQPVPNDIWDALAKWPQRIVDSKDYYQPRFYNVRWRQIDDEYLKIFPDLVREKDQVLGIDERFPNLPADPEAATEIIVNKQTPEIEALYHSYIEAGFDDARTAYEGKSSRKPAAARKVFEQRLRKLNRLFNEARKLFLETDDYSDQFAEKALRPVLDTAQAEASSLIDTLVQDIALQVMQQDEEDVTTGIDEEASENDAEELEVGEADEDAWQAQVDAIVREFAKLDGYDVKLRTKDVFVQHDALSASKSWKAQVRRYAQDDEWKLTDESDKIIVEGSHDEQGDVRPEYLEYLQTELGIYQADGTIKKKFLDLLDPDCIEANDLNLSAGRYKPFTLEAVEYDPPAQIIRELHDMEAQIQRGLDDLLKMVEEENEH